ncbi:MAG: CvpA family protein [Eubacterium sp.]|nr:CvpA family protein [Eubacterium sp.]MCM1213034.1 CvpA family protein [Lachnospiraceae bacterium]MCM1304152.1 CvpA family protein [Butyrivibrio sp.]MCM1344703.1 CvpA family protein [Muribaculaceae bacterium]MCM1241128.1 CvpA family protein [Lachnospiraceae bacterium]
MNLLLIVVAVAALCKLVDGYKKGMVKEIISLVSMVVLCVVAGLLSFAAKNYMTGKTMGVVIAVVLLCLIGIAHHLLGLVFFSAKIISGLPVIHSVNKLLGAVFGILEVVLILWTVYTFMMMGDSGSMSVVAGIISEYTGESRILTWIYQHNLIAVGVEKIIGGSWQIPWAI